MQQPLWTDLRPLHWPEGNKPIERDRLAIALQIVMVGSSISAFIYTLWWFWIAAAAWYSLMVLHSRRGRPTVQRIVNQLTARSAFPAESWGSLERAALAEIAGLIIAAEIGWPNGNSLPEDPWEIVFYCPAGDGGEGVVIFHELAERTKHRWQLNDVATFGQFIDGNLPRA